MGHLLEHLLEQKLGLLGLLLEHELVQSDELMGWLLELCRASRWALQTDRHLDRIVG